MVRFLKEYNVKAEICKSLDKVDLQELCDATEEAIIGGGGFGWISPPSLKMLQNYWKGCLLYTSPSPRDRFLSRMPSSA